jgi:hypothetical protein
MYFFDNDANKRYPLAGYLPIHIDCDFDLHIEDDDIVTGFDYEGRVVNLDTGADVINFNTVLDVGNKDVHFILSETETGTLTAGTNYIYIIKRTDDKDFTMPILGGYVAIYET